MRLTTALILCLLVLSACSKVAEVELQAPPKAETPPTAEGVLQKAAAALDKISDAKLTIENLDADGRLVSKTVVEYKKPAMYRMEVTDTASTSKHLYISDGKTRWHYQPDDQIVTVLSLKEEGVFQPELGLEPIITGLPTPLYLILSISPERAAEKYAIEYSGTEESGGREIYALKLTEKTRHKWAEPYSGERTARGNTFIYAVRKSSAAAEESHTFIKLGVDVKTGAIIVREHHLQYYISATKAVKLEEFDGEISLPVGFVNDDPYGTVGVRTKYSGVELNAGIPDDRFTFNLPADAIILDGNILEKAGENIPEYQEKVKAAPEDVALRYALTRLYERRFMDYSANKTESLPHLEKLVQLKPNMITARRELVNALSVLNRHKEALEHCQKLVELKPDMAAAHLLLGQIYLQINQPEKALEHLQKAAGLAPMRIWNRQGIAEAYERLGKPQEAIQQYRQMMGLDGENYAIYWQKAEVVERLLALYEDEELEQLIAEFQGRAAANPRDISLHRLIGSAYERMGDRTKAVEAYRKALKLILETRPSYESLDYRAHNKLKLLEMYDELAVFYEKRMETATGYARANLQRMIIEIYVQQGEIDKCLAIYEEAAKQGQTEQLLYRFRSGGRKFLETLQERLEETPEDVRLCKLLGDSYTVRIFDRPNLPEAATMYERGLELAPNDAKFLAALAKVRSQQRDFEEAIKLYKQIVEIKPDEPYYRAQLAYIYNQTGMHQDAIDIGQALVTESQEDSSAHGVLATTYLNANMNAEALAEYERALELTADRSGHGDGGFFRKGMAKAYENMGEYEKADAEYDRLGNAMHVYERMQVYQQRGDYDGLKDYAIKKMKTGQGWEVQNVISELVQNFSRQNRLDELITFFEDAIEKEPDNASNYFALGEIHKQQGEKAEAMERYEKAAQLSPGNEEMHNRLGQVYLEQKMFEKAAASYEKAIKLRPSYTHLYSQLASAYAGLGQTEDIVKLADKMKKQMRGDGHSYLTLGDIYIAGQFYDEAIAAYEKAVKDSPGERYFQEKLLRCYKQAGKAEEAEKLETEIGAGPEYGIPAAPKIKRVPDFTLKGLSGEEIKLSNFRGRVVFLNFWATLSPLCYREIPVLEKLYKQYKDNGFVVIGVSVDPGGEDVVKSFVEKAKITYPIVMATEELLSSYRQATGEELKIIPTTFIINKSGVLSGTHVSAQSKEAFEKDILRLLK